MHVERASPVHSETRLQACIVSFYARHTVKTECFVSTETGGYSAATSLLGAKHRKTKHFVSSLWCFNVTPRGNVKHPRVDGQTRMLVPRSTELCFETPRDTQRNTNLKVSFRGQWLLGTLLSVLRGAKPGVSLHWLGLHVTLILLSPKRLYWKPSVLSALKIGKTSVCICRKLCICV